MGWRRRNIINLGTILFAGLCAAALGRGETPASAPAAGAHPTPLTLSPAMEAAVGQLHADSFGARQKAAQAIKEALAAQFAAILEAEDPESQARIADLLEFQAGLTRWALETLKMPPDQSAAMLRWGLSREHYMDVAMAYSSNPEARVAACRALTPGQDEQGSALLARLAADDDRAVYLAAMEALWDRPATEAVVNVLWDRAVDSTISPAVRLRTAQGGQPLMFRGQPLPATPNYSTAVRALDNDIATEVLIQLNSPLVAKRLVRFFHDMQNSDNPNVINATMVLGRTAGMVNLYKLSEAYHPTEALGELIQMVSAPVKSRSLGRINNDTYFISNRTNVILLIIRLSNQRTDDYGVKQMPQLGTLSAFATEGDEDDAVAKLQAWWQTNKGKYLTPGGKAGGEKKAPDIVVPYGTAPTATK